MKEKGFTKMMSKANKQADDLDPVRVILWVYPGEPDVYYDQPPGDRAGYRKPRKYSEAQKQALERAIGESVQIVKP